MTTKKTKPEVFGDGCNGALISSIAGYNLIADNIILQLKSGETMKLYYQVDYLAELAFAKLKTYFKVDTPESSACNVCSNKDKICERENRSYCDFCYASDREHFKAPEGAENE